MRVLASAELEPFLADESPPRDLSVDLFSGDVQLPGGDYAGVIPVVSNAIGPVQLERLPALLVIANYGVGYDNIDVAAARRHGVSVSNTPDVLTGATAELTWALILAAARRIVEGEALIRSGRWSGWTPTQLLGTSLEGKVLGIVGAGRIGREVGRRAAAFGMRVAYWNRTGRTRWERETGAERLGLAELLTMADVVSLHVALTAETDRLIDARALERMKPGAILVNTARGGVVDEAALIDALGSGSLAAAGLDVYAVEPEIPDRLRELDNVVLLPHLGSATAEARRGMWQLAWANLLRGIRREPLLTPVPEP